MALTPSQMAAAVVKQAKRGRLSNGQIRAECSPLIGKWLRSMDWFLTAYPDYESQTELYKEIKKHLFRITGRKPAVTKRPDPFPCSDPRQKSFF